MCQSHVPFSTTCIVSPPRPRLVLTTSMFYSLPKTFDLSSYVEELAQVFSCVPSLLCPHSRTYNPIVVAFIDFEAKHVEDRLAPSKGSFSPSL